MFMFERALKGSRKYWLWVFALASCTGAGFFFYLGQLDEGLGITGLGQDVAWGLYIAQFTFFVGIAASSAIVALSFYLYDYSILGRIVVLGESVAVSATITSMLFVCVDVGQPTRLLNILLHPGPGSMMLWDLIALAGHVVINGLIALFILRAEQNDKSPAGWIKPVIMISIPWAIGLRTVTALLYAGLPSRSFWLTAMMAPRALASAVAAGPALLIILCVAMRALCRFDAGKEIVQKLAQITAYAVLTNLFFILMEVFTVFYSRIPAHMESYEYMFMGLSGHMQSVPWMWASMGMAVVGVILLLMPRAGRNDRMLVLASALVFISVWIEKLAGLVVAGFIPSPFGAVTDYVPSVAELAITLGICAFGGLTLTFFIKIALSVRQVES